MSIFGISVTGLNAASIGLATTSHNIANASTPGYNRQTLVQGANVPMFTGAGFVGQGTRTETIKRVYDQFLSQQVLSAQTSAAEMDGYSTQISQIDNLLADSSAGLSPALSAFFKGVQEVAANPSSVAARQSMLSSANSLVSSFQSLDQRLSEIRTGVNGQITSEVSAINSSAKEIADINGRINLARASGAGQEPNDLLDQRDQLIADLNKHIRVTTVGQADGSLSVFFGNGQPLVVGSESYSLKAGPAADDPQRVVVALQSSGGVAARIPESQLTGGTLGGLIAFRSQSLDGAQNALGRVAIALAQNVNDQHRLGQDLNGVLGGNFFSMASPVALASSSNTSVPAAAVTAAFTATAASDLTTSDYQLTYSAANTFTMTRLSDGASWTGAGLNPAAALTDLMTNQMPGQGFSITLANTPNVGDTFKIEPTRAGSYGLGVLVTDPRSIAAAAPFRTAAALANAGTGSIAAGTVNTPLNANIQQPVTITFVDATHFNVTGTGTGNPANVLYTPGADISYNGWTMQISGAPATGDVFTVSTNSNGVGDNRNATALAALQTKSTMIGGTASYEAAYAQLVSEVGNKAREVQTIGKSEQAFADQAVSAQQSVSGVNLDEEAANLLRYQQAYQAAAKAIDIAGKLFDQLLTLGA